MRETAHFRGAAVGHALYARIRSDRTGRPDCIRPYRTRARTCRAVDLRLELRRETGQRQRTEREPDVPQRDVEVPRDEQQVENDAPPSHAATTYPPTLGFSATSARTSS